MMTHSAESNSPTILNVCYADADKQAYGLTPEGPADTIELKIPGQTKYVFIAREAVDAITEEIHLSMDDRAAVRLAVGEACNNAVRYSKATGVSAPSPVLISFRVGQDALEIDVANSGSEFLPAVGTKMPDPLSESGRGVALIEAMMDSVEFQAANGKTIVRMRKFRNPK